MVKSSRHYIPAVTMAPQSTARNLMESWRPSNLEYMWRKSARGGAPLLTYGTIGVVSIIGTSLLFSAVAGYVERECTSRYEVDFEIPRDKKGRPNFKFDFTPGEGKPPAGIDAEE